MKAKIKSGHELLFTQGESNKWDRLTDKLIVNFNEKWTLEYYEMNDKILTINTEKGKVEIEFDKVPIVSLRNENKDQVVFNIL